MKGWLGDRGRGRVFCLYELNWIIWVALRNQVSLLTCSLFYFSATMATAPYNYSYIFKYIIIGKYLWMLCVGTWPVPVLLCFQFVLLPPQSPRVTTLHLLEHFASLISKVLEFMLKADWKPLHGAHKPLSGCIVVFKCCF